MHALAPSSGTQRHVGARLANPIGLASAALLAIASPVLAQNTVAADAAPQLASSESPAGGQAAAQTSPPSSDAELAKKLANPVSSMISVPLQTNVDCCYGPENGVRYTLNIQPVIPVNLSADWHLITRTILPIISQGETTAGEGGRFGFGDITQSFFFTPTFVRGVVIGAGPVFLWPTGTDHLGSHQWAAGPTGIIVKQSGHVTVGLLANHLWTYAGPADRESISSTLLQPFLNYTFPSTTSLSLNTESSYDWTHQQWTVPINAGVAHLYKIGEQRVQLGLTGRVYAVKPAGGPDWGVRMTATLLFPQH